MDSSKTSPILVTGATGYVASHIIKQLLEQGHYVRGTVRSLKNKEKYQFLYDLVPEKSQNLEFAEADLLDTEKWNTAVQGVERILHVASPFPTASPRDENELIKPAVEGTLNVLNAALQNNVKRVVITSSLAALLYGNEGKTVKPQDWSNEASCSAYSKSKLRAEKAAWDFYEKNKEKIEIATVNPGFILGPVFTASTGSSEQLVKDFISGAFPVVPKINLCVADVRDVADCHIKALFAPNSAGKRYLCSAGSLWMSDMTAILKEEFKQYGYKIPTMEVGKCLMTIAGIFDKRVRDNVYEVGHERKADSSLSVEELGVKYRPLKETLVEMGYSLIKIGSVVDKINKK
jgi:nucleoside-diphosphate-sugar epimerase